MRKEFELTDEQLSVILSASKPTSGIIAGGRMGPTPQDMANIAWEKLGEELGFKYMTVQLVPNKGDKVFTAEVV